MKYTPEEKALREARLRPGLSSLERIAFHEAGHAVAAVLHRRGLRKATIVPDKESGTLGCVFTGRFGSRFKPDAHAGRKERDLIEGDVTVSLAGPVAEALASGRWNHVGASRDYHHAVDLLSYLCGGRELQAYVNLLSVRTEAMFVNVDVHWRAVEQLAEVLLREKTIGGRRARAIIQEAWSSS